MVIRMDQDRMKLGEEVRSSGRPDYRRMRFYVNKVRKDNVLREPPFFPREIAEAYGLTVKEVRFNSEHSAVSGFLDFAEKAIYVNADDPYTRQTFTIAHELGHFLMHKEVYRKNPNLYQVLLRMPIGAETDPLEKEANSFAAHLLVPELELKRFSSFGALDDLASYFMVSKDVIRSRLEFENFRS